MVLPGLLSPCLNYCASWAPAAIYWSGDIPDCGESGEPLLIVPSLATPDIHVRFGEPLLIFLVAFGDTYSWFWSSGDISWSGQPLMIIPIVTSPNWYFLVVCPYWYSLVSHVPADINLWFDEPPLLISGVVYKSLVLFPDLVSLCECFLIWWAHVNVSWCGEPLLNIPYDISVSGEPLSGDLLLAIATFSASDVPGSFFWKKESLCWYCCVGRVPVDIPSSNEPLQLSSGWGVLLIFLCLVLLH
jgi:hypothetical protein